MKKSESTRMNILKKAFALIYQHGYQSTSIDQILLTTQVTKGAFYYHFKNKDEMGLAIIHELLYPTLSASFTSPLKNVDNPLNAIHNLMRYLLLEDEYLRPEFGCPAANLTQEMAPWNKEFTKVLHELTEQWVDMLVQALQRGQENGYVSREVDPAQATTFILSGYWGIRNFGKLGKGDKAYIPYLDELRRYLQSLSIK